MCKFADDVENRFSFNISAFCWTATWILFERLLFATNCNRKLTKTRSNTVILRSTKQQSQHTVHRILAVILTSNHQHTLTLRVWDCLWYAFLAVSYFVCILSKRFQLQCWCVAHILAHEIISLNNKMRNEQNEFEEKYLEGFLLENT